VTLHFLHRSPPPQHAPRRARRLTPDAGRGVAGQRADGSFLLDAALCAALGPALAPRDVRALAAAPGAPREDGALAALAALAALRARFGARRAEWELCEAKALRALARAGVAAPDADALAAEFARRLPALAGPAASVAA